MADWYFFPFTAAEIIDQSTADWKARRPAGGLLAVHMFEHYVTMADGSTISPLSV